MSTRLTSLVCRARLVSFKLSVSESLLNHFVVMARGLELEHSVVLIANYDDAFCQTLVCFKLVFKRLIGSLPFRFD